MKSQRSFKIETDFFLKQRNSDVRVRKTEQCRGTVSVPESYWHTLQTASELAKGRPVEKMTLMGKFRKSQAFLRGMDDAHIAER